ncbi:MAG: hypothetical protein ACTSUF_01195 [Candidatus Heimdallarchaeaceae archaeon]
MKLSFELKKKQFIYIISIFFVVTILVSILFFSIPHHNDWYENKIILYSFNRIDNFHYENHSITNTYCEEFFFKIIKVGDILVSLECDYPPISQLSLVQTLLSNDSHTIILTKTFPEAFQYITEIPILYNNTISSIELLIFPPIVIEPDWDIIRSSSKSLKELLDSKLLYAKSLNVSIESQTINFSYLAEVSNPFNRNNPKVNTSIGVSYQFTKGGTLKNWSVKKEVFFTTEVYETTHILMHKKSIVLTKMKTAQGIFSIGTITLLMVIYIIFKRQRKKEQATNNQKPNKQKNKSHTTS